MLVCACMCVTCAGHACVRAGSQWTPSTSLACTAASCCGSCMHVPPPHTHGPMHGCMCVHMLVTCHICAVCDLCDMRTPFFTGNATSHTPMHAARMYDAHDAFVGLLWKSGGALGVNKIGHTVQALPSVPAKLVVYLAARCTVRSVTQGLRV